MGPRCSLDVTGTDRKDGGHKTGRRLATLVAMIAIVPGAAIWSGTLFAQCSDQIHSNLEWILRDHDIQHDLTLDSSRSQPRDIGALETDGDASPPTIANRRLPLPRYLKKSFTRQPRDRVC